MGVTDAIQSGINRGNNALANASNNVRAGTQQVIARAFSRQPNYFGTLGNVFAPGLDDPLNANAAFREFNQSIVASMRGEDPFERGIAASGASNKALDAGLRTMLPTLTGEASNSVAQEMLGEGTGAAIGKVAARFGGRALAVEGRAIAAESTPLVTLNKAAGDAFELDVIANVLPKAQFNIKTQITVKSSGPSSLKVRLDAMGEDIVTGETKLSDMKASSTAPFTANQTVAYPELELYGGGGGGEGKAPYVGVTNIPPTTVDVIRKTKQ